MTPFLLTMWGYVDNPFANVRTYSSGSIRDTPVISSG